MEKIKVTICTGTSCYVMGGSELLLLADYLTAEQSEAVDLEGTTCLGFCNSHSAGLPPFVQVDGVTVEQASVHTVAAQIDAALAARSRT